MKMSSAAAIKSLETTRQCLEMRRAGVDYAAIGKALGLSEKAALMRVKRVLDKAGLITAAEGLAFKELEQSRRDRAMVALWPKVQAGDVRSINTMLKIQERTAQAMGLDAPPKAPETDPCLDNTPDNRERIGHLFILTNGNGGIQPGDSLPPGFEEPSGLDECPPAD